jgi:benzoyl-CoA reductase/2-hydroxyglutaryl-CoA dehydratase subunit BcrC/BadD/HgdB
MSAPPQALARIVESLDEARRQGFITIKTLKEQGRGVAGIIGPRVPPELFTAAALVPVWLGREEPEPPPEEPIPESCPPLRSLAAAALGGTCPYLYFSALVAGDDSCPAAAALYRALRTVTAVHVLRLPRPGGGGGMAEIQALRESIEARFGRAISPAALRGAIREGNRERILQAELRGLARAAPPPLTGLWRSRILYGLRFRFSRRERIRELEEVIRLIRRGCGAGRSMVPAGARRIILTGCPLGWTGAVIRLVEEAGAVVVHEELRGPRGLIPETGDPFQALAGYYLGTGPGIPETAPDPLNAASFAPEGIIDLGFPPCPAGGPGENPPAFPDLPRLSLPPPASPGGAARLKAPIAAFLQTL